MSSTKKKIGLRATKISFNFYSIIYDVEFADGKEHKGIIAQTVSPNNVHEKELILKTTVLDKDNMRVIYTPSNYTPHFFQAIYENTLFNYEEYKNELDKVYLVGDIVGYVIV